MAKVTFHFHQREHCDVAAKLLWPSFGNTSPFLGAAHWRQTPGRSPKPYSLWKKKCTRDMFRSRAINSVRCRHLLYVLAGLAPALEMWHRLWAHTSCSQLLLSTLHGSKLLGCGRGPVIAQPTFNTVNPACPMGQATQRTSLPSSDNACFWESVLHLPRCSVLVPPAK